MKRDSGGNTMCKDLLNSEKTTLVKGEVEKWSCHVLKTRQTHSCWVRSLWFFIWTIWRFLFIFLGVSIFFYFFIVFFALAFCLILNKLPFLQCIFKLCLLFSFIYLYYLVTFCCRTMVLCEALWVCLVYEKCYINKVALPTLNCVGCLATLFYMEPVPWRQPGKCN